VAAPAPDTAELLGRLHDDVQACVHDVRRLVARMRPTALEQLGLVEALRAHADALSTRTGGALAVAVSAPAVPAVPADVELAAYRIGMEAMTNVARHARARRCTVTVGTVGSTALRLVVDDDGAGLDPEAVGAGLGLRSMRERAHELGGRCTVEPRPGGGTRVTADLPLARKAVP
jgi:signal transduction histidine kinase